MRKVFETEKQAELLAELTKLQIRQDMLADLARTAQEYGEVEAESRLYGELSDTYREERRIKNDLEDLTDRYEVGDGVNSGGNGDSYPYRVVEVSKSGKTIEVRPMKYYADPSQLNEMGHQNWIVEDYADDEEVGTSTVTLRKNGRWAEKGASSRSGYGNFYPGAYYSYNWSF